MALSTTGAGFAIIDRQGRRLVVLDQAHGLPSNAVYALAVDREGAIWAALERGIARIETPSPASFFDASDGFQGAFNYRRHEGTLYLAWQGGVKYLRPATPGASAALVTVPGAGNQCWWFATMRDPAGRRPPALAGGLHRRALRDSRRQLPSRCMRRPTARFAARLCWHRRWTRHDSG